MNTSNDQTIFFEKALLWVKINFQKYRWAFLSSLIFGALTYVFAFTNKLINHDEVISMFAKGTGLSSGRWALDLMHYIFPDFSMPWIYGVISVVLISISICIIVNIFEIKNIWFQIILSGLIISFPSLVGTFSYMFTASSYAVSFLFAVISVKMFSKNSWISRIVAVVFLTLSLGIYQSYIAITASLLLLILLKKTLYSDEKINKLIGEGVIYLIGLAVSLIAYYAITQLLLHITATEFNSYASTNISSGENSLLDKVLIAYISFLEAILKSKFCLVPTFASRIVHIVLFLCAGVSILFAWVKTNLSKKLLAILILILFPLSVNCIFLFSSKDAIHTLVLYGFISVYVLFAIVFDNSVGTNQESQKIKSFCLKAVNEILAWGLMFVIMTNVYIGNTVYLRMYLSYENVYAFYSSVITQVKSTPGFDSSSKIALVGSAGNSLHFHSAFNDISTEITGTSGINVNSYTRQDFIVNFVGTELPFANQYEIEEVKKTAEFAEMPIYPYYGSIREIGDLVVVKFQE